MIIADFNTRDQLCNLAQKSIHIQDIYFPYNMI